MIVMGLLAVVIAFHPPVVLVRISPSTRRTLMGLVSGVLGVGIVAVAGEPVLSLIDVSPPTFRTATGAVVGITGLRWLMGPTPRPDPESLDHVAAGILVCATPGFVMMAVSLSVDEGWGVSLVGIVVAAAATWWLRDMPRLRGATSVRLAGAASVLIGGMLVVDGIRSV